MFCGQRHTGHPGANCAPYYWVIMGSGRCVYYVLYCIKIIRVLYLYYVFAYPGTDGRTATASEGGMEGGREPSEGYPRLNFESLCGAPGGGIA